MRKLLFLMMAIALFSVAGCNESKKSLDTDAIRQSDSLQRLIAQKDIEINDIMETFNQIEEGFREINEAENRVSIIKDGEGASRRQKLIENVQFISNTMKQNKTLIEKLRRQLQESNIKGEQFKKTVENLVAELEEKNRQLDQLRVELNAKNIHITELDQTITKLNDNVASLQDESSKKSETISAQDKQLNTAWYVFGTKKELKEQRIIDGSKVLESNFNKSYFTKIDIRVDKEIMLYSKYARLLTTHPSDSYTLQKNTSNQYVLRITNPQLFWSTSKYLVVLVK